MNRFRQKLASFMYGRYGADTLYWWSFGAIVVIWVLRLILSAFGLGIASLILGIINTVILIIAIFRFMSRNIYKRSAENRAFLRIKGKLFGGVTLLRDRIRDRKTHVFKKCPTCKAMLRLPKKSGDHTVRCPKCGNRFGVKIK